MPLLKDTRTDGDTNILHSYSHWQKNYIIILKLPKYFYNEIKKYIYRVPYFSYFTKNPLSPMSYFTQIN